MIIPFFIPHAGCPHQCVFCDQRSITGKAGPPAPSSVGSTIRLYLATARSSGRAEVAFYGGSFTALPLELQRAYLEAVTPSIDAGQVAGIRLSTRPDAVSADVLRLLKKHQVSTVELGAQSMDDEVLRCSERGHSAADTVRAVHLLREHGFKVGIQLMPGLPGDSAETFGNTVLRVIDLRPELVRIYPALVIRETPLELLYRAGGYSPLPLDEAVAWCRDALSRFRQAGIEVTRIGLQPTEELERPGTIVAGPYHPALRQLVESSLMLERMRSLLGLVRRGTDVALSVNPRDLSFAIGQRRKNVHLLQSEFGIASLLFRTDASVPRGQVRSHPACLPASPGV